MIHSQKKLIFLFIILIKTLFISAQADSLIKQVPLSTNKEKVNLYIKICKQLAKSDTLKRMAYADSALNLSEKSNDIEQIIAARHNKANVLQNYKLFEKAKQYYLSAINLAEKAEGSSEPENIYYDLGTMYYEADSFEQSVKAHQKALSISKIKNDTLGILKAEQAVAIMLWRMGKLKEAEQHYLLALEIAKGVKDTVLTANILNSLGAVYWGYGSYHSAFKYFNEASQLTRIIGNRKRLSLILSNIGLIYSEWGEFEKAKNEFEEALKIAKEEDYTYSLAYAYVNLGEYYHKKEKYEKAISYFDSALVSYKLISKKIGMAYSYRNIGKTYLSMKKYQKALKYFKSAVNTAKIINSKHHWALSLYGIAQSYFEMKNYQLAKKYASESLKISKEENYKDIIKDIYFLLSNIAEKENNLSTALKYYKKASVLKDSVFNEKHGKQIAEMQAIYEIEKAERENALLKKEEQVKNIEIRANKNKIRLQNIFLISLSIIIAIIGILVLVLLKTKKKLLESQKLLLQQNEQVNNQKEELLVQSKSLTEINLLLNKRSKELEDKTKVLEKNLDELERATQFKNKMFSIIGHDLRGPLGTINSILALLEDKSLDIKRSEKLIHSVKNSSVSAYNLLENLLSWANNEQGKINYEPQKINLKEMVLNNYNLLKETADKKEISIDININEECTVIADYNMLDTIIRNLLSNALKFSYPKGKIEISAQNTGDFTDISVRDYGTGMNREELNKVMDKALYYSSFGTNREKGTGIGLQLCFEFIKANKGIYRIESKKGEGTNFIFSLPYANKI